MKAISYKSPASVSVGVPVQPVYIQHTISYYFHFHSVHSFCVWTERQR